MTENPIDIVDEFRTLDRDHLVAHLREAGGTVRGNAVRCPFHDDRHASGSIYATPEGVWRFKCHVCGLNEDVIGIEARLRNTTSADLIRERRREAQASPVRQPAKATPRREVRTFASLEALKSAYPEPRREACHVYHHPDTRQRELIVLRLRLPEGGKKFVQCHATPDGVVHECRPEGLLPLYNRARCKAAPEVIVVEGEKCVEALQRAGIVATTSPMGAGKASYADWSPLAGKVVYVWPDNDDPGKAHARDVVEILGRLEPRPDVRLIDPEPFDLPPKGDAVEFLETYGEGDAEDARRAVAAVLAVAQPVGASDPLRKRLDAIRAGKLRSVGWPWASVTFWSKALLPGTVTSICGDPGAGKSYLGLESFAYWHERGVRAACHMLEDGQDFHLNRLLAILEENGDHADIDWQGKHPDDVEAAYARHRARLDAMAPYIDAADDGVTYDYLLKWMQRRAAQGCRVLLIDPITAADVDPQRPWVEDRRFIMTAKAVAREYGLSVVLMTHPRTSKGGTKATLHDMAGGAAFRQFTHCVMWLERHDEPKKVIVSGPVGDFNASINRTLKLSKTRNGRGAGMSIGFNFDHRLRFAEQGVIRKVKRTTEPQEVDA